MANCSCGGTVCWISNRAYTDVNFPSPDDGDQIAVTMVGECDTCGQAHQGTFEGCLAKVQDLGHKAEQMY